MKKRVYLLGLIALIVALIVSIQLNIQLYREAADNYRDLNGVQILPLFKSVSTNSRRCRSFQNNVRLSFRTPKTIS